MTLTSADDALGSPFQIQSPVPPPSRIGGGQVGRRSLKQAHDLNQVRLAGTVRPDQHIEWIQCQSLPVRTERESVP